MFRRKQATVMVDEKAGIRRSTLSPHELLIRPYGDEVTTVGDIFAYGARKHGDRTACSYRDIVGIVEETKQVPKSEGSGTEKKTWKYFNLSPPKPVTYIQLDQKVTKLVSGLLAAHLTTPETPIASRPRASIYADTSMNWQLMSQTLARLGCPITTAYTTLGEEGLLHSLVEPDVELIYCGEDQVKLVAKVIGRAEKVKWVIYETSDRLDQSHVETIKKTISGRGGEVFTFPELEALGARSPAAADDLKIRPGPDDLFCIMYTSGSTGPPKGVLLTHGNVIASLSGSIKLYDHWFLPKSDVLLAFLPLAHILEQFLEYTMYLLGVHVAYGTVKTLLDDSVRDCQGDFAAYRPTLMAGVPAIFEVIRKGMMKRIGEAGPILGTVFNLAVKGKQTLPWPMNAVIDRVLFARVKQATGGRLRLAVCGGGAISDSTQLFLSTVLMPIMQGYGLTETCGMATIVTPDMWELGIAGSLGPSCEAKLVDQPDLGYLTSSSPPRGELWLRGANITQGYFKRDDLNRETLTPDGWFKTGDIAQWETNGTLRIIDRVKNLIKLQNGEYLALDHVESIYKACDVVMMLCIHASPSADRPIALVYPHEGNLLNHLKAAGITVQGGPPQWVNDAQVKGFVKKSLLESARRGGLGKAEMIKDVILTPDEWSPDNGMLTPAMKLARPQIAAKYAKEINTASTQ